MGTMTFQLPSALNGDALRELERTCLAGGPDNMPWPTQLVLEPTQVRVQRPVDESGYLVIPWTLEDFGQLMGATATLMERPTPYNLMVELARGKVNQVRCQAWDWGVGGLQIPPALEQKIRDASLTFGRAIAALPGDEASKQAAQALHLGYQSADGLVRAYVDQVLSIRHQRQERLDSGLSCRLGTSLLPPPLGAAFLQTCNTACLPMTWNTIEVEEGTYSWEQTDALLNGVQAQGLDVLAGPLVDFSSASLPAWLWLWEKDLTSLASFTCKFVEAAVRRYKGKVRRWQVAAASNCANVLSLGEDELLGLTYRLAEAARQVDPGLEILIGIAQPWGEYMALEDRTHSPFIFADTLIRSGLNLAALDVEVVMGVTPRGSYCRDLLETSRLLDLYALLGVPLHVTLGYPSGDKADPDADPEVRVTGGRWHAGFTPADQADWGAAFVSLALCKPFVQGVRWAHFSDAEPHQFPFCGLVDARGQPKPALHVLRELREKHLR